MNESGTWRVICGAVALALVVSWSQVFADTWGPPQKEHWSENKRFVLQVEYPAQAAGLSLWEKTEGGLKPLWRRGYVDRIWPPHQAHVTNDGKYVVLRDVYHNLGSGKVIVILGDGGRVLGSYELSEFLPQDEIASARRTVSSLWWSENAWFSLIHDEREFVLVTQEGTARSFDLPTGKLLELNDAQRTEIVNLVRKDAEAWAASEKAWDQIRGITLLGALRVQDATPRAKKLFQDKIPTGSVMRGDKPTVPTSDVQEAAALALLRLIGADAIPIIEAELPQANWYMKEKLMAVLKRLDAKRGEVVQTPHSTAAKAMWMRLAGSPGDDIRHPALCEVLRRDDGAFLRRHPELVESESDAVRSHALAVLSKIESAEALPLLRKAIADKKETVRRSALRQFIARQPPDIEAVLLPYLDDEYAPIRLDVICELVCRGHPAAVTKLRGIIEAWPNADVNGTDKWLQRSVIQDFCRLIADRQLNEVRDNLAAIRSVSAASTRTAVTGALAALGDSQAISDLHRHTGEDDYFDRIFAVEMCRYLSDEKSAALVKQAAASNDGFLRSAATRDLRRFGDKQKNEAAGKN